MVFTPIIDELVISQQRQDRLQEAEKERLLVSITPSSNRNKRSFSNVSKWLNIRLTRLRCTLFPFNTSPACAPYNI